MPDYPNSKRFYFFGGTENHALNNAQREQSICFSHSMVLICLIAVVMLLQACIGSKPRASSSLREASILSGLLIAENNYLAFDAVGTRPAQFVDEVDLSSLFADIIPGQSTVVRLEYADLINLQRDTFRLSNSRLRTTFTTDRRYVFFALPSAAEYEVYQVLCSIDQIREELDSDLMQEICELSLCSQSRFPANDLFNRFPELGPFEQQLRLNGLFVGGLQANVSQRSACEMCRNYRKAAIYIPAASCALRKPPLPKLKVVNLIPPALSFESNQDSEPFLAIDPSNADRMVASAFTPNHFNVNDTLAPIYYTSDGGDSWSLQNIVPSAGSFSGTGDITMAFEASGGKLHAGILKIPGNLLLNLLKTESVNSSSAMQIMQSQPWIDQPFIQSKKVGNDQLIVTGLNDFNNNGSRTASVAVSFDQGENYSFESIEHRSGFGQNGPSIRPAIHADGTVYVAYFNRIRSEGNVRISNVVVVRDDNLRPGQIDFNDLVDSRDGQIGSVVERAVRIPWVNASALGSERIGSTLSISVDPNDSRIVYIVWADRIGDGDIYSLHLRRSTDGGLSWSDDLRTIRDATCTSIHVADNGSCGFLYHRLTGAPGRWEVHLEQSRDGFESFDDKILSNHPASRPFRRFLPYLGDYNYLSSHEDEFRGVFSAGNTPNETYFPQGVRFQRIVDTRTKKLFDTGGDEVPASIDPFYFSVPVIE